MPFPVQNIREAAKAKGLTLKNIEQALSIGNGVIAKWEKNKSSPPYDRIVAIANFLEVPVSQLTGGDKQDLATEALSKIQGDMSKQAKTFGEIQDLQVDLLNATLDQLKEALTGLDTSAKFDLAMFLLNDVKGNEDK